MFEPFNKIPRLNKEVTITEKIDGTNAQVHIISVDDWHLYGMLDGHPSVDYKPEYLMAESTDCDYYMLAGSRNRYLSLEEDNFGFARWVHENNDELFKFGPGRHYGEWWGEGIQRGYGVEGKRLTMFNPRWADQGPDCVDTAPVIASSTGFDSCMVEDAMDVLKRDGSYIAPGFMDPEGIVIYHAGSNQLFKQTFEHDEGKWSNT